LRGYVCSSHPRRLSQRRNVSVQIMSKLTYVVCLFVGGYVMCKGVVKVWICGPCSAPRS